MIVTNAAGFIKRKTEGAAKRDTEGKCDEPGDARSVSNRTAFIEKLLKPLVDR